MITEKNTSPRKAFRSAPKAFEQDASLENASCSDSKEEQAVLSGVKPVLELLEREPERIDAVLVRKGKRSQDTDRILDLCRTAKVRFTLADAQSLDRLSPRRASRRRRPVFRGRFHRVRRSAHGRYGRSPAAHPCA